MADIIDDGNTKIAIVPTITNIAAPTAAECNAGIVVTTITTPDGLIGFEPTTAPVDNSHIGSTVDTNRGGRDSYSNTALKLKKQTGTDTAYNTLVKGYTAYVVIRRDTPHAPAFAASDKVEVFPIEVGRNARSAPTKNTLATNTFPMFIYADPDLRAVVAA